LCLESLVPQAQANAVEICVVDNNSTTDISPLRVRFPDVKFVTESEKGAAAARNTGVRHTTAPLLLFTDADCIPSDNWIRTALDLGNFDGVSGGQIQVFDETPRPRTGAQAYETVFAFPQAFYVSRKGFSVTANLITTRRVFVDVGPFDGRVTEDQDWCRRATAKGYPIRYCPNLVVSHPTRNDWAQLRRKWIRCNNENYFLNGTSLGDRTRWGIRALVIFCMGVVLIPRVLCDERLDRGEKFRGVLTFAFTSGGAVWMDVASGFSR
jgi:GT2 family glycosyltransferase